MVDRKRNSKLFLLFLAVFIDLVGFGIIIPILPFFAVELGANEFEYGLIIALFSLMQFIFAPIWGSVSDRIGRRPVILMGLGGSVIGFSIFGVTTNLLMLYLSRIVAGIFTAATLTVANAYAADITPPKERNQVFGLLSAAFGLGFAVGPAIGGWLSGHQFLHFSPYATPGFFAAGLSFLNMVGAYFILDESISMENRSNEQRKMFAVLGFFELRNYRNAFTSVLMFALVTFGFSNFIASFALYAPRVDGRVDEVVLGYFYTFVGSLLFVLQFVMVRPLLKKFGEGPVVRLGTFAIMFAFLSIPYIGRYELFFVAAIPMIIGISSLNPAFTGLLSKAVPDRSQGEALGINQGMASFSRVIGPLLAGALMGINDTYPFYFGALIFAILFVISVLYLNYNIVYVESVERSAVGAEIPS